MSNANRRLEQVEPLLNERVLAVEQMKPFVLWLSAAAVVHAASPYGKLSSATDSGALGTQTWPRTTRPFPHVATLRQLHDPRSP